MTLKQAVNSRVTIKLGDRVVTPAGWVRSDRVLLEGLEIGCVQTRRAMQGIETLTITRRSQIRGYDIDWLVGQAGRVDPTRTAA